MIRSVDVACRAAACAAVGQARRVHLRMVALGVIEWPTLLCATCGAVMQQTGGWLSAAATDEGGASSPGSNSQPSSETPPITGGPRTPNPQTTAPAAAPASTRPRRRAAAAGTVPSTATAGPATGGEPG